jgi:hypothetical protein
LIVVDLNSRITEDIVRLGVNYKFGSTGAVIARY